MYITADEDDVCRALVAFEECHCRISPSGGHTVASIVELQRCIEEYDPSPLPRVRSTWAATLRSSGFCRYDAALKASRMYTTQIKGKVGEMNVVTSHRLVHLPETAGALGYSNAGDTSFHERSHGPTKAAWTRTSRRPSTAVQSVCMQVAQGERVAASLPTQNSPVATNSSPSNVSSTAARLVNTTNTACGVHPAGSLVLNPNPRAAGPPSVGRSPSGSSELLWPPDSLASSAKMHKTQADIVRKALACYFTAAGRTDTAFNEAIAAPIKLLSGIRLLDSCNGNALIGIAHASPNWNTVPRYNDVTVLLEESAVTHARLALVMRVCGEDLVLVRHYRTAEAPGRSAARKSLDELLGPMLEFVPLSAVGAWEILPVTSVHDVWKLEDDVRRTGRYFVNQFVGAYCANVPEDEDDDPADSPPA